METTRCLSKFVLLLLVFLQSAHALDPDIAADVQAQTSSITAIVQSFTHFRGQAFDRLAGGDCCHVCFSSVTDAPFGPMRPPWSCVVLECPCSVLSSPRCSLLRWVPLSFHARRGD